MSAKADEWIEKLELQKHPEGGYYKETYRSETILSSKALPDGFKGNRSCSTAIYYMLKENQTSAFHRLKSDEVFHFYDGCAFKLWVIHPDGELSEINLGNDLKAGELPQAIVKAGCWFASENVDKKSFSLVGCTVSPGFDFLDFELGKGDELLKLYPMHAELIARLTID